MSEPDTGLTQPDTRTYTMLLWIYRTAILIGLALVPLVVYAYHHAY